MRTPTRQIDQGNHNMSSSKQVNEHCVRILHTWVTGKKNGDAGVLFFFTR